MEKEKSGAIAPKAGDSVDYIHTGKYWRDTREYISTGVIERIDYRSYPWLDAPIPEYFIRDDKDGKLYIAIKIL